MFKRTILAGLFLSLSFAAVGQPTSSGAGGAVTLAKINAAASAGTVTAGNLTLSGSQGEILGAAGSVSAGNNQIVGTSTGTVINTVSGKSTQIAVAGSPLFNVGASLGSVGATRWAIGNYAVGAVSSANAGGYSDGNSIFWNSISTGFHRFLVAGTFNSSFGASNNLQGVNRWALGTYATGAVTDTNAGGYSDGAGMAWNASTGNTHSWLVAGNTVLTVGTAGLSLPSAGHTLTASAISILSDAANSLTLNVPTGGQLTVKVNAVANSVFGTSAGTAGANRWAIGTYATSTVATGTTGIYSDGVYLYYNTGSSTRTHTFSTGGATSFVISGSAVTSSLPVILKGYTVAGLPTGTVGMTAYVTDATSPTYNGALTGGGSVTCKVFYNGTAWVSN